MYAYEPSYRYALFYDLGTVLNELSGNKIEFNDTFDVSSNNIKLLPPIPDNTNKVKKLNTVYRGRFYKLIDKPSSDNSSIITTHVTFLQTNGGYNMMIDDLLLYSRSLEKYYEFTTLKIFKRKLDELYFDNDTDAFGAVIYELSDDIINNPYNMNFINSLKMYDYIYSINYEEFIDIEIKDPKNYTKIEIESYFLSYSDLSNYTFNSSILNFPISSAKYWQNMLDDNI